MAPLSGVDDVLMPQMGGIEATSAIKQRWPEVGVVAVTSFLQEAKIRAALEAGAAGYLLKDADAAELADAIRAAIAGEVAAGAEGQRDGIEPPGT